MKSFLFYMLKFLGKLTLTKAQSPPNQKKVSQFKIYLLCKVFINAKAFYNINAFGFGFKIKKHADMYHYRSMQP